MTFDHNSLERLKKLGRQLPKELLKTTNLSSEKSNDSRNQKLHPVEIENDPEKLFQELIKISPDGNVPSHLIDRLKKLESKAIKTTIKNDLDVDDNSKENTFSDSLSLYTQFKQLLLEDEVN